MVMWVGFRLLCLVFSSLAGFLFWSLMIWFLCVSFWFCDCRLRLYFYGNFTVSFCNWFIEKQVSCVSRVECSEGQKQFLVIQVKIVRLLLSTRSCPAVSCQGLIQISFSMTSGRRVTTFKTAFEDQCHVGVIHFLSWHAVLVSGLVWMSHSIFRIMNRQKSSCTSKGLREQSYCGLQLCSNQPVVIMTRQ